MLKDRVHFPPGGFKFYQPETNWNAPDNLGFDAVVQAIIDHREANPGRFKWATDAASVAAELDAFCEARLRQTYGDKAKQWLLGAPATAQPFPWRPLRERRAVAEDAAAGAKRAVAGIGLLASWLGDGLKPVDAKTAESRAAICAKCEFNRKPNLVQKAYGAVADGLHLLMNARAELKLSTPHDDKLETCSACDCRLALKVFTPAEHIKKNTSDAIAADLDPSCWILPLLK